MTRTLPNAVADAAATVSPALRDACARLSPAMRTVVGYHLGFLDADGHPVQSAGGKSVRAALALLSARAAGGTDADGMPGAVAVELVHTFSLLHDDIMDADAERHHRPAAWAVFGSARAILAGDDVLMLAFRVLLDSGSPYRVAALESLADATARLIAGQAADLDLEGRVDATPQECMRMCAGKTGALLECAASIGAVLAGAGAEVTDPLRAFGGHVGLAFQAVDDLLGIWGDPAVTGKPVFSDLVKRKTSLPVAVTLAGGGEDARRLAALLARPGLDAGELAAAADLMEVGRARTAEVADSELGRALAALDAAPIDAAARDDLAAIARFVAERSF
jgi:geranylgeranyl diphosphate synthase type I